jgi:hypothetical protein
MTDRLYPRRSTTQELARCPTTRKCSSTATRRPRPGADFRRRPDHGGRRARAGRREPGRRHRRRARQALKDGRTIRRGRGYSVRVTAPSTVHLAMIEHSSAALMQSPAEPQGPRNPLHPSGSRTGHALTSRATPRTATRVRGVAVRAKFDPEVDPNDHMTIARAAGTVEKSSRDD